jgi:hypothetical protein
MTTIELAKKKYAEKMANAGARWKKGVTDKVSRYASELARFLGLPDISASKKEAWDSGVGRVSAEDFSKAVAGKETKWADRLREAFAP